MLEAISRTRPIAVTRGCEVVGRTAALGAVQGNPENLADFSKPVIPSTGLVEAFFALWNLHVIT